MPRPATAGHWVAILLLWIGISGCDFVSTPDRFIDDTVEPPVVAAVDYATIRSGQHLAGEIVLTVDLDSIRGQVDFLQVMVNDEIVASVSEAPFTFRIRTNEFPDGEATIGLGIYKRGGNQGLLGLAGAPAITLVTPVVFDQRQPTPVRDLRGVWGENGVELRWTPNQDPNFFAYLIIRDATWSDAPSGSSEFGFNAVVIDTVYNASAAVYRDLVAPSVYGLSSTYRVAVSNRATAATSTDLALAYRPSTYIRDGLATNSIPHPTLDLAYHLDYNTLTVWSLTNGATTATVNLSEFIQTPELTDSGYKVIVGFRQDGTEFYVYAADPASGVERTELLAFSATDEPSFLRRLDAFPTNATSIELGPDGFLVAAVDDKLHTYDTASGELRSTLANSRNTPVYRAGQRVLTKFFDLDANACVLRSYNPATGAAVGEVTYVDGGSGCGQVFVMNEGNTIYLVSFDEKRFRRVNVDLTDLSEAMDFPTTSGDPISQISISGGQLLLAEDSFNTPFQSSMIRHIGADGQTVRREWRFAERIAQIIPSANGDAFYAISSGDPSSRIWSVPLEN